MNYGLFLNGSSIQSSKQAVFIVNEDHLNIDLYKGEPIAFTEINDLDCRTNLFKLNNLNDGVYDLKQSDVCINFPVVEITYQTESLDSFSEFIDQEDEKLHELYGHIVAKKILAGGQLFIKDFDLASLTQQDVLKFYIMWAYDSAKYNEIPVSR